jgi:hypothetical protein
MINMPETFADLLKVKTRWTYGSLELANARPDLNVNDQHRYKGVIPHLLLRPWLWPNIPAFVLVYLYSHHAARQKLAEISPAIWERDDSTRPMPRQTRPAA